MSDDAFIYFIRPVGKFGPVKIGWSKTPEKRLKAFDDASPYSLEIAVQIRGSRQLEMNIHDCFFDSYARKEWFRGSWKLRELIDQLRAGVPIEKALDLSDRQGRVNVDERDLSFITPDYLEYRSYLARLVWANRKLGIGNVPDYIQKPIDCWRSHGRPEQPVINELDEFFQNLKSSKRRAA